MDTEEQTKWVNIFYTIIQEYGMQIDQIVGNKKTKGFIYVRYNQLNIGKKINDKNSIQFDLHNFKVNDPGRNELVVSNDVDTLILTFKNLKYKEVIKIVLDKFRIS